jgi:hypothetical protein
MRLFELGENSGLRRDHFIRSEMGGVFHTDKFTFKFASSYNHNLSKAMPVQWILTNGRNLAALKDVNTWSAEALHGQNRISTPPMWIRVRLLHAEYGHKRRLNICKVRRQKIGVFTRDDLSVYSE